MKSRIVLIGIIVIAVLTGVFFLIRRNPTQQPSSVAQGTVYPMESAVRQGSTISGDSQTQTQGNPTPFQIANAPSTSPSGSSASGAASAPSEPFILPSPSTAATPATTMDEIRAKLASPDFWRMTVPDLTKMDPVLKQAYEQASKAYQDKMTEWAKTYIAQRLPNLTHPLTEEDINSILWPQEYLDGLHKIEDVMIHEGFLKPEERHELKNEDDIYAFYKDLLRYMRSKDMVTDEQMAGFTQGITEVLPELINGERESLRFTIPRKSVIVPGGQRLVKNTSIKDMAYDLLTGLAEVFSGAQTAHAQIPGAPGWHTFPDCYKDLAPNPVPGSNFITFCCNCGIRFQRAGQVCVPIPTFDCGIQNIICDSGIFQGCPPGVPLGCLNQVCRFWPNAIWDPLSGICGCG